MRKKYAIQIALSPGNGDWIYLTEDQLSVHNKRTYVGFGMVYPVIFEEYWEAEDAAQIWRKKGDTTNDYVRVVEYKDPL